MSESDLRRLLGAESESFALRERVCDGDVYLVHEDGRTARRSTVDRVWRCLLPNTFRFAGRRPARREDAGIRAWLATLSGAPSVVGGRRSRALSSLASGVADALRNLDAVRSDTSESTAAMLPRAGSESPEHRALKALLAGWAADHRDAENVLIEERLLVPPTPMRLASRSVVPDIRMRTDMGEIQVEIETLRGIAGPHELPLVAFEDKLRARLEHAAAAGAAELWVVLPPDGLVLVAGPLNELHARLQRDSELPLRFFTVDYVAKEPVQISFMQRESALSITDGASFTSTPSSSVPIPQLKLADVVGADEMKRLVEREMIPAKRDAVHARLGIPPARSLLLYGLPGCGKSYLARAIAGELGRPLHHVVASDVTSQWLGAGVGKIREVFDAVVEQAPCALLIDELDGIAPPRSTALNMHTDERRQVAELLAQIERLRSVDVVLLATTNYLEGLDSAIRRAGRFDLRAPILPPNAQGRAALLEHGLPAKARRGFRGVAEIDWPALGRRTILFTPADLRTVVDSALRLSIARGGKRPLLSTEDFGVAIERHSASITPAMVREWLEEIGSALEPGARAWLEDEARAAERGLRATGHKRIGFHAR